MAAQRNSEARYSIRAAGFYHEAWLFQKTTRVVRKNVLPGSGKPSASS